MHTNNNTHMYSRHIDFPNTISSSIGHNNNIGHDNNNINDDANNSDVFSPMSLLDIMSMNTPMSHVDHIMQELQKMRLEADQDCVSAFSSPILVKPSIT